MARLQIMNDGVLLDGKWVPATHVHLDMDAKSKVVHVQIVLALAERDVVVDVPAQVKLINDENPRVVDLKPDPMLQGWVPTGSRRCEIP